MPSLPLKWHGGKHYLARKIVELMPPHLHYVEPYFGGGAVLFARDPDRNWHEGAPDYDGSAKMRGCSEVVNDINPWLSVFWQVATSPGLFENFYRKASSTPFSERAWKDAKAHFRNGPHDRCPDCALAFFIRYRQSRQGLGEDFATLSRNRTRRGMNEQVSAWLSAVEGLPEAHARLKRVAIIGPMDGVEAIRQQDGPRTHFYCDPPYLPESRQTKDAYEHEMTMEQHQTLLTTLSHIKGTFQLSGYRNEMYDAFTRRGRWRCVEFDVPNNASGAKRKERKTECVWMNY